MPDAAMLVPVYMRHLSEEDLDAAIIAVHESPADKRFLAAVSQAGDH